MERYVIRACGSLGSMMWMWVSKEKGHPFTTMKDNARLYKTYAGASRAMENLKKNASHWRHVNSACEVSMMEVEV